MTKSSLHGCRGIIVLAAVAFFLSGCETTVSINARMPAKYPVAADLRKVAVAGFDGSGGSAFAEAFRTQLVAVKFDGASHFTLLGGSGAAITNTEAATRYGRSLGADGVYFGKVLNANWNDEAYDGVGSQCTEYSNNGICLKTKVIKVRCTKRTMQMSVAPELVRVSDGAVVYSSQQSGSAETSWCADQSPAVSNDQLMAKARDRIFEQVRMDIAPYNTVMRATIKKESDGLPPGETEKFKAAAAAAATGDMIGACRLWKEIAAAVPSHAWTVYNLGICAEAAAKYSDALTLYRSAQTLTPKADSAVQASITRAAQLLEAENQLIAQQKESEQRIALAQKQREEREAAERAEQQRREADEQRRRTAAEQAAKKELAAKRAQYVAAYGQDIADAILAKRVVIGMPAEALIEVRGKPDRKDAVGPGEELWHYGKTQIALIKGKVTYVGE